MNNVCLTGRMVKDPVLKEDYRGLSVLNFMLAVDRNKKKTDFIPIVCWNNLAVSVSKCGFQGMCMAVSGHLRQDDYEKNGIAFQGLTVEAYSIDFLSRRPKAGAAPTLEDVTGLDDLPFTCEGL